MKRSSQALLRTRYEDLQFVCPRYDVGGFYSICFGGSYNPLLDRLRSSDVVLDGGANIGVFSVRAARLANCVYAIEPDPVNYDFLVRNLRINSATNVTPIKAALADRDGTAFLEGEGEVAHLSDVGRSVETVTISSATSGRNPTVVKLDIEGAELLALSDLSVLKSVRLLCFELDRAGLNRVMKVWNHSSLPVQSYAELKRYLDSAGYSVSDYTHAEIRPFRHARLLDLIRAEISTGLFGTRFFVNFLLSTGLNAWNTTSLNGTDINMIYAIRD